MTKQNVSAETAETVPNQTTTQIVKGLFKKNKKVIMGAVAVVAVGVLVKLAEGRYVIEGVASDETEFATGSPKGVTCADGWPSPSIGSKGACSYHGGVARDTPDDVDDADPGPDCSPT